MTANWRPDLWFGLGLNADPNDSTVPVLWNDLTNSLRGATEIARGRQYELALTQAGEPSFVVDDVDQYLDPDNTSSPYYPYVLPMRQVCLLGVWPNPEAGNLINTNVFPDAPDPSFESYTNGAAAPSWLGTFSGLETTPTITTTNPQQGTKCVTYDIVTNSAEQGTYIHVRTIPGRTYTASWYVRQTSASTQRIVVDDALFGDMFGRTVSSGWGTALLGGGWSTAGGSASDYAVAAGVGTHSLTSVNVARTTQLAGAIEDANVRVTISTSAVAAGAAIRAGVIGRYADSSNYYRGVASFETTGAVTGYIIKRVAGVETTIASATITGLTHTASSQYTLEFFFTGTDLGLRIWAAGGTYPSLQVSGTDSAITAAGAIGTHSILVTGNTNTLPVTVSFDDFVSQGSLIGSSTTATNSYQRLTVTFTAGQVPTHFIRLTTAPGTGTAGTINIDALQLEPGSSATTFTTSGSVIYPIWRGYIERVPTSWMYKGFRGWCNLGCTDAMATFAGIPAHSELFNAVMDLSPVYYWPLWEPAEAVSFAEIVAGASPAVFNTSKYGVGTLPESGVTLSPAGDPGGMGVTITPQGDNSSTHQLATTLGVGPLVKYTSAPVAQPATIGTSWAMSASVWFVADTTTGGTSWVLDVLRVDAGSLIYRPIALLIGNTNATVRMDNYSGTTAYSSTRSTSSSGITVTDGSVHNLVGVVVQNSTNTSVTAYLDGIDCGTTTVTTASLGGVLGGQANSVLIGGTETVDTFLALLNGTVSHVALWHRALSAGEVTALWDAGGLGMAGETSSERMARLASRYYYAGGQADFSAAGRSVMSASSASKNTSLGDLFTRVVQSENGVLWPDSDGYVNFEARDDRFKRLTSTYTFGEAGGSEYPYEENIQYDYDLTHLYNNVVVTRTGGLAQQSTDAASQRRYFVGNYTLDVDLESDLETLDAANWLVATYKDPHRRIAALALNPAANGDLWPVVFNLEVGTRVTVKRRSPAANGGTGLTVSKDFFVERIAHELNLGVEDENVWNVELLLSPANGSGGIPQPWILDDTTYSVLGSTTVLGW